MRALKSPAIKERASVLKVRLKLSLNPRTPTSAATPTATDNTTNPNLPGADFKSRHAIAAALSQLSARLAIGLVSHARDNLRHRWKRIFYDHPVSKNDLSIFAARHFSI